MEVALRYIQLTLFTLLTWFKLLKRFTLLTWFALLTWFTLLLTLFCTIQTALNSSMYALTHIVRKG